jgi:hypothetical protein
MFSALSAHEQRRRDEAAIDHVRERLQVADVVALELGIACLLSEVRVTG